jgi:hypothetical protein
MICKSLSFLPSSARLTQDMQDSYKWTSKVALSTLAAEVKDVEIEGKQIVGRWGKELWHRVSPSRRTLAEQFVNSPNDPQGILQFTRKYGPLSKPHANKDFRQSVQQWRSHQAWLRGHWTITPLGFKVGMKDGEMLGITPEKLSLTVESLERFVEFEIWLSPIARRRRCKRPHCETPYFIASNPKQLFCDEKCAEWGQQQHKQKWWAEHGEQWRKRRKTKETKGGS